MHPITDQPTRERALYRAAARVYAQAFDAVFVDPVRARRRFRSAVDWDQRDGFKALLLHPDEIGPRRLRAYASAVYDPAFIYWTMRDRRPRAFLIRIADAIKAEAGRLDHIARKEAAREESQKADAHAIRVRQEREEARRAVRAMVEHAAAVYRRPAPACRVILRVARRHGVERARVLLKAQPEFYGDLRTVKHPRGWGLLVFISTDEALAALPRFLADAFDPAARVRRWRPKPGAADRADASAERCRRAHHKLSATEPKAGTMKIAARLIAILCRRRDVDEPPQGAGPPPLSKQIAAMLPDRMANLIVEALRLSEKESGEDPLWVRDGMSRELSRSLGRDLEPPKNRWERERQRGRGLSI